MNELDFTDMREELADVRQPDFAGIRAAGHRRRNLRRGGLALSGLAVAVVAALLGTFFLVDTTQQHPLDLPDPVPGLLKGAEFPTAKPATLRMIEYVNQWQAYALVKDRTGNILARTHDGGATWQAWRLPAGITAPNVMRFQGGQTIVVYDLPRPPLSIPYVSRDGGRSWTKGNDFGGPIDHVPAGWAVGSMARPGAGLTEGARLVAYDPKTGAPRPLSTRPGIVRGDHGWPGVVEARNGSLWAPPLDDDWSGAPMVSQDRGATWFTGNVSPPGPEYVVTEFRSWDSYDGTTAYANVEFRPEANVKPGEDRMSWPSAGPGSVPLTHADARTMVYVTHDGGRSWQPVGTASDRSPIVVGSDGTVLTINPGSENRPPVHGIGTLVASHDGGRTFAPVTGVGEIQDLARTAGGVIRIGEMATKSAPARELLSEDGDNWTQAPNPPWHQ